MARQVIFVIVFAVTLSFGWWPFNFHDGNDARWDGETGLMHFHESFGSGVEASRGIAYVDRDLAPRRWKEISIVIECSGEYNGLGLGAAFELRDLSQPGLPELLVSQWLDHLAVRSKRIGLGWPRGYAEIGYKDAFVGDDIRRIVLSSNDRGTTVYVDAAEPRFHRDFPLIDSNREIGGRIVVGNSANGRQPFLGSIRRIAIYDQSINPRSLDNGEAKPVFACDFPLGPDAAISGSEGLALVVPERFAPLRRQYFTPIAFNQNERGMLYDVVINLLGFMPFGAALSLLVGHSPNCSWWRATILAFAASLAFSFIIEFAQAYLPNRDSSLRDLALNALGGLIGGAIVAPLRRGNSGRGTIDLVRPFR